MKNRKRFLSLMISLGMLFSLLVRPGTVFAEDASAASSGMAPSEEWLPDVITEEEAAENGYAFRITEAEPDLNTLIFRNTDGTNTMRIFDHPVKYLDENGAVKDITLDIRTSQTGFVSKQSAVRTEFPKMLSDGITLAYDDIRITLIPQQAVPEETERKTEITASLSSDKRTVTYSCGEKTAFEYSLTYTGFKEDIVVSEYTGQTEYYFLLNTNGLVLEKLDGSYYLTNGKGEIKAVIGDIIIFTADERNNAFGNMTHETVKEGKQYILTIHIDGDYLKDEKTVYPIRIDPTIEINYEGNGAGAIEDVTLNSLDSSSPNSGSLFVGKRETYGISRTLMRFPGLDLSEISSAFYITEARVELRDLMCYSTQLPVSCYAFKGSWNISTVRWSNVSPDNYDTTELDSKVVYYRNGDYSITGNYARYSFDITQAVKWWKNGTYSKDCGIIFKTTSAVETGSTNVSVCFASYNRSSNKPSFTLTYNSGISVNNSSVTMNIGETWNALSNIYSCTPTTATLRWSSSNERVASINSSTGVITAKACGKITITVYQLENTSVSASFVLVINPQTAQTRGITSGSVYMIKNISKGKYLSATSSTQVTVENKDVYDGRQLWYVEWTGTGYRLYSMGLKDISSNGNNETMLRGYTSGNSPRVQSNYPTYNKWNISYNSSNGYYYLVNTSYNNTSLSTDPANNNVSHISLSSETNYARWSFEKIETETFNNYWAGSYSGQGSIIYVKINIDDSGSDSVYLNSIISSTDFDVIDQWKNRSSHVVIYGPNDTVPSGITAFQITYKGYTPSSTNEYGVTKPYGALLETNLSSTWNKVYIYLNTSTSGALNGASNVVIEKVILHELGHALKLAHPKQTTDLASVTNGRGGYSYDNSVSAIMNQGDPTYSGNLTCASPKWHDIINLKNKW